MRKKYPTDLKDREWVLIERHFKSLSINQRISIKILDSTGSKDEKKVSNRFKR